MKLLIVMALQNYIAGKALTIHLVQYSHFIIKRCVRSHMAKEWWSQELNSCSLTPSLVVVLVCYTCLTEC